MKGYRTIIVNALALIFSLLAGYGFEVSAENQGQISTGILAIVNIALRFMTTTPAGKSE
jgi:hypothetical protein